METNNCVFCSGRIRTPAAMATYSSHRLIMGEKGKLTIFSVSLGIFDDFLQKCLLSKPLRFILLLSKSVNLIGCRGGKKGQFRKYLKIFFSETIWGMKPKLGIHA